MGFERWTYDFETNTITLYVWEDKIFHGPQLVIGQLKYGNVLENDEKKVKQSEYEWGFEAQIYRTKKKLRWGVVNTWSQEDWDRLKNEESEEKHFWFMNDL